MGKMTKESFNNIKYKVHSLDDFLLSNVLTIDAICDDRGGAKYPVKGREIESTILFADITNFSQRTKDLNPVETLIFVNNFIAWITAEAVRDYPCIVDKYIGDEIMLVFSKEFGSSDPFRDALSVARWMSEKDFWSYCPHIGIASGSILVGYTGSAIKYNTTVFGKPVTLASRCAGIHANGSSSCSIAFPATHWTYKSLEEIFPKITYVGCGKESEMPLSWELQPARKESLKGIGEIEIMSIVHGIKHIPSQSAEERAKELYKQIISSMTKR